MRFISVVFCNVFKTASALQLNIAYDANVSIKCFKLPRNDRFLILVIHVGHS